MPAAAVIRGPQALSGFIGRIGSVGGSLSFLLNSRGSTSGRPEKLANSRASEAGGTAGVGVKTVDICRNTESEGS